MKAELAAVEAAWIKLGVMLAAQKSSVTPDLEHLILDTARWSTASPRLTVMAVTWLSRYAGLVAEHRLAALVRQNVHEELKPRIGLLLDLASTISHRHRNLSRALRWCSPSEPARPLFDVERASPALVSRAERRASEVSRRWNLWTEPLVPKYDALRPASWLIFENPSLRFRADFRGDLRASILLFLNEDPRAGASVSELARRCLASRPAVLRAVEELELGGHIQRRRIGRASEAVLPAV